MSRYYVDKFLYRVDCDAQALTAYVSDPVGFVMSWETGDGLQLHEGERSTGLTFTKRSAPCCSNAATRRCTGSARTRSLLSTLMVAVHAPSTTSSSPSRTTTAPASPDSGSRLRNIGHVLCSRARRATGHR